jgi:hypothetical protein
VLTGAAFADSVDASRSMTLCVFGGSVIGNSVFDGSMFVDSVFADPVFATVFGDSCLLELRLRLSVAGSRSMTLCVC